MSEPKTRRIRIIHNGSPNPLGMQILDAETGEMIKYVTRVELLADAQTNEVRAVLYIIPELDILVDAEVRVDGRKNDNHD